MAKKSSRRIRWITGVLLCLILLVGGVTWQWWVNRHVPQWRLLQQVFDIENGDIDRSALQEFGWNLAILGRDHEVRELDLHPQFEFPPIEVDRQKLELNIVPWRDGMREAAAEHRIIMIMENHFVSKHREMIGATLPILRGAGFTHYAAEAIGESGRSLESRGYPVVKTGYYTSDPQFGLAIREAIDFEFNVLGYDFRPFTHEMREEYAAKELAKLIINDFESRLVVHAGHAHVLKHPTDIGLRWLASLLWEKTDIEPFTIWQWSSMLEAREYQVVAEAIAELGDFEEPVMLMPPPGTASGLLNVPRVDAILVHPPDHSMAPNERTVLFPDDMQGIRGRWDTPQWPVVVAANKMGEPITAIPLDQVMLRHGEQEFVLWIPNSTPFTLSVFDQNGPLNTKTENGDDLVIIQIDD